MVDQLERIQADIIAYREAVDRIFFPALTSTEGWQQRLWEILICASQLYLDYLLVMKDLPELDAISSRGGSRNRVDADALREQQLREKLRHELESSLCWSQHFKPDNPLAEAIGVRTPRDYIESLTLHLPEIYEETFRVEACAKDFLAHRGDSALAQLVVGLQHLGRNHISFVLQTLQWAADEGSWQDTTS